MDLLGANRFRPVVCSNRCCGYSTRRAMAHAAAGLPELQNCASALLIAATRSDADAITIITSSARASSVGGTSRAPASRG